MSTAAVVRDLGEGFKLLTQSTERSLSESPVGKDLVEFIKNDIEPAIGQYGERLTKQINTATGNLHTPPEAMEKARQVVFDSAFGTKRQGLLPILQVAKQQKGDVHAATMANAMNTLLKDENRAIGWRSKAAKMGIPIKISSYYTSPTEGGLERAIKTGSHRFFLPLISIPHAFQAPLNSLMVNGIADTTRALYEFASNPDAARQLAQDSGAMMQDAVYEHLNIMKKSTMFGTLLDPLKKVFNYERKLGIAFSAVGGKWSAIRAADEFFATGSKRAELQLKLLGLDPVLIRSQQGILTPNDIEKAAYRATSEIMGLRSQLETPFMWETNAMSRLMTLYKHYGFRQGRLLKNMFVKAYQGEGLVGVTKMAAILGLAFPIAGELIKGAEGVVTAKNPWSRENQKNNFLNSEYLDAIANAGGFGIQYSIMRSSRHNHLSGYVMGPHISTMVDLAQDMMNLRGHSVARDVARRLGLPGRIISNTILKPKKKEGA